MKTSVAILLGISAFANGTAFFTNSEINPVPGEPFTLTWDDATGPVTILLKDGPESALKTVDTLTSSGTGGEYTFTLDPADYPSGTYAFEIVDGGESNYSKQFSFAGTGTQAAETTSGSASSSSATTSVSSGTTSTTSATTSASDEKTTSSSTTSAASSRTSSTDNASTTDGTGETDVPGAAGRVSSPLALILVAIAAMLYLN